MPREFVAFRLSSSALEEIKALAEIETEGELSAMLRKLLAEAITARKPQVKPSPASTAARRSAVDQPLPETAPLSKADQQRQLREARYVR